MLCGECRQEERAFDLARSYGLYAGPLRGAILQMKFRRRERVGKRLGELLAQVWTAAEEAEPLVPFQLTPTIGQPVLPRPSCDRVGQGERAEIVGTALVVPAPLHPSRKRERGFNQAELLARGLVRKLGRSGGKPGPRVETNCLTRIRATVPQTGLSLAARRENVQGAFAVERPERIRGRTIVLIDDVMTTGATLSACAIALKRAGASRVLALTLARAAPQFPDFSDSVPRIPVDEFGRNQP